MMLHEWVSSMLQAITMAYTHKRPVINENTAIKFMHTAKNNLE
jgi:hypothetical protein